MAAGANPPRNERPADHLIRWKEARVRKVSRHRKRLTKGFSEGDSGEIFRDLKRGKCAKEGETEGEIPPAPDEKKESLEERRPKPD